MGIIEILLVIVGLMLFEAVSSIDNAVINADVLSTMSKKGRRWFLTWGIFFSVFVVRGLLPLLIVFLLNPSLGLWGAVTASFTSDPAAREAIEASKPILLAGGGMYLLLLWVHWLFLERKNFAFAFEKRVFDVFSVWFYSIASILLVGICALTLHDPLIALGAVIGSSAFFITAGFKTNAEAKEEELVASHKSDMSKILYLELIDATFSIDGVLGAFAFTTSIPLILAGNGLGAVIIRYITIHGTDKVKNYPFLTNGAMYSAGLLGTIMLIESLGVELPFWISPLATIGIVGYFFYRSTRFQPNLS